MSLSGSHCTSQVDDDETLLFHGADVLTVAELELPTNGLAIRRAPEQNWDLGPNMTERFHMPVFAKASIVFSNFVVYGLVASCGINFTTALWKGSLAEMGSTSLGAIAILGALSAICFSFWPCLEDSGEKNTAGYAGEKLLHSCLMIIQMLFAKYAHSGIMGIPIVQQHEWLTNLAGGVLGIVYTFIALFAVLHALWGFGELNDTLWDRYQRRLKGSTKSKPSKS